MNAWTNSNTGHNRYISTGPTPDGKVKDLVIAVGYLGFTDGATIDKAVNLDGHIIPLILRVPDMLDALLRCKPWLEGYQYTLNGSDNGELEALIQFVEQLTSPTREELDARSR
jgi:hypothetical protein